MILLRLKQASVFFMLEQQNTKRAKKTENFFFPEQFYFPQKMISTQKENPEAQVVKGLYKLGDYPRYVGQTPPPPTPAHSLLHRISLPWERTSRQQSQQTQNRCAPLRVLRSLALSMYFQFLFSSSLHFINCLFEKHNQ